jgi:hypothetical protein
MLVGPPFRCFVPLGRQKADFGRDRVGRSKQGAGGGHESTSGTGCALWPPLPRVARGLRATRESGVTSSDGKAWDPQQNVSGAGTSSGPALTVILSRGVMLVGHG